MKEDRTGKLGSSDAPIIGGTLPARWGRGWHSLWQYHTGGAPAPDLGSDDGTGPAAVGILVEPVIATLYERLEGVPLVTAPRMIQHPDHPWAVCSPDRIAHAVDPWAVELKLVGRPSSDWGAGMADVPAYVYDQAQWQMWVLGFQRCDVAALLRGTEFRVYQVPRDQGRIDVLQAEAGRFLGYVERREAPPIDGSDGSHKWLSEQHQKAGPAVRRLSDGEAEPVFALIQARAAHAAAESARKQAEATVKAIIGDDLGVSGPWGQVLWSPVHRKPVTDWRGVVGKIRSAVPDATLTEAIEGCTGDAKTHRALRCEFEAEGGE